MTLYCIDDVTVFFVFFCLLFIILSSFIMPYRQHKNTYNERNIYYKNENYKKDMTVVQLQYGVTKNY